MTSNRLNVGVSISKVSKIRFLTNENTQNYLIIRLHTKPKCDSIRLVEKGSLESDAP